MDFDEDYDDPEPIRLTALGAIARIVLGLMAAGLGLAVYALTAGMD